MTDKMNLVPAIKEMEKTIREITADYETKIKELVDGLAVLRKINTTCEKCNGEGKYLRSRTCAEDDRPDPNDPADYRECNDCNGTGKAKYKEVKLNG